MTFAVNEKLDHAIARPIARTYRRITPHFVQTGVSNFMDNINYPIVIVNDLLQAKFKPRTFGHGPVHLEYHRRRRGTFRSGDRRGPR
jgi:hypothetical protein